MFYLEPRGGRPSRLQVNPANRENRQDAHCKTASPIGCAGGLCGGCAGVVRAFCRAGICSGPAEPVFSVWILHGLSPNSFDYMLSTEFQTSDLVIPIAQLTRLQVEKGAPSLGSFNTSRLTCQIPG